MHVVGTRCDESDHRNPKSTVAADGVTRALNTVRQLADRPARLMDPMALLASLELLADAARESNHADRTKYNAIFKQCRPLANSPRLSDVVVRILGDEEQKQVATQIQKILRAPSLSPSYNAQSGDRYGQGEPNVGPTFGGRGPGRRTPARGRCFICRQFGHYAAQCNGLGGPSPPHLVMPITIEPSKPRMCHDERFLNLWIKDCPLRLDYISNLPRYVTKASFQTTMDDKSGYDHVALSPQSRTYFGIEWQGWYFVYHTIPFGWKASAYVYHTIGMAATSHIRSMGIPCSQYIDDRHFGQLTPPHELAPTTQAWSDLELAEAAIFTAASVLTSLGYFVGLAKSSLVPSRIVRFLGFMVDSDRQAFILPKEKKEKFARLREAILASRSTSIKMLQRLAGKITSFSIAVPAAQLYTREIFAAIGGYSNSARPIKISGLLREEIEHCRFLDNWQECLHWPQEKHITIKISSDASNYAWGGVISVPGGSPTEIRDYWGVESRNLPIVVKEALALLYTLQAAQTVITNARVDAHTDNMSFLHSWKKLGGKNRQLNDVLKRLFSATLASNVHLNLQYIPSCSNPADPPSRQTSDLDCKLSPEAWAKVEENFGPHTMDLMSLDSNVQRDSSGKPLKHFTPFFTPLSSGVNVFAQVIHREENVYVFPPFVLVGPLLKFLSEFEAGFTIIVPKLYPLPFWWPILRSLCKSSVKLGSKGEKH
ncbi:hypothetical protein QZH41_014933, partial [Actinostola sp. cb2023]